MSQNMKKRVLGLVLCLALLLTVSFNGQVTAANEGEVKNVIFLVSDGMGATHTTLARWYKGAPLAAEEIVTGGVRTFSAESAITDSAPAATAFAAGYKSNTKYISVLPKTVTTPGVEPVQNQDIFKPVATILEGAKLAGKSTGLVATSNIQHATPAAFSAHHVNRNNYNELAEQQVYQQMDVVLGGGSQYLFPKELGGKREDKDNLYLKLREMGYDYVTSRSDLLASQNNKIWGMFASDAMSYNMDKESHEPSLAEMTQKAIEVLSKNNKGFFLFVEASKVDWASHANDPVGVISDVLAWDEAVKVALDFAKKDGKTLVITFSDHGNGGMSIGNKASDKNYDTLKVSSIIDPLKKAKLTGEGLEKKLNADRSNIKEVMAEYFGITDLTEEEIKTIKEARPGSLNYAAGPIISSRSYIGWTTNGHTGEDLFLYAYGPQKPTGMIDNTDVARIIAKAMKFDLDELNKKLFLNAREAFASVGATVSLDKSDEKNPVLVVTKGQAKAELPVSTNMFKMNGQTIYMKSLTILSEGTTYVPQEAIDLFITGTK
ncbi:MAG: alkaline phosphatase [Peptococcaceae bacterium]|nr:alkaline phosphatase [Peptococcaceae bacterium]